MSPSNLRFDVQCEWVDLRYDPSFHVSSPPTLATVLPPECQRVFASEGRLRRLPSMPRSCSSHAECLSDSLYYTNAGLASRRFTLY